MSLPTLLRDVFQPKREPPFFGLLNLWAIEDGVLVGVDLQLTKVYRLTCPDVLFVSEADVLAHSTALQRLLDQLPTGSAAQLIIRVRWDGGRHLDEYAAVPRPDGEMLRFILNERISFLKRQKFKRVEFFLAVTTYPTVPDLSALRLRPGTLKVPSFTDELAAQHKRRVQELEKIGGAVVASLRDSKVAAAPLSEAELLAFLYERLNPARAKDTPAPAVRRAVTLRSQLALNACEAGFDTVTIDGHHHRAVNLQARPTDLDARLIPILLNELEGDCDLVVALHTLPQEKAEKDVRAAANTAFFLRTFHVTYHEADEKQVQADEVLSYAQRNGQKFYLASCHVVLRSPDKKVLTQNTDAAVRAFSRLSDAVAVVDDMCHLPLFLATLPGHSHLNARTHLVHSEVAARMMTMSSTWDGTRNPQVIIPGMDGKLLSLDLFSSDELTAKHSLILGVSGEGKSVLTNTLLTSFFCADEENHVIVIDDGGSYRRLCELLGGQYLEPTLDGTYSFNPFLAKEHAFDESGQLDADFVSFITLLVQLMMRRPDLSNNEKSIIQKCVFAAYKSAKGPAPLLGDLRQAFGSFAGDDDDVKLARTFYKDLDLWTEGTYGRLLNRPSTFDASKRFIVFDLNRMTQEDLKPVVLLIIKSVIHPKLANKRLRKMIALDEVWKFLKEKAGADLVTEWYKTGRRFNTAVSVITQSAEDLLRSQAAAAIGDNSTVKWVLNLGGGYDKLHELKLGEEEVAAIKALGDNKERNKYRKVFLRFGSRKVVIKNLLSPTAYWLYTTDPQDLRCELELRAKEPAWSAVKVLEALGRMKDSHPEWRTDDFLREIRAGRY